jgi:type IV pilus assembly protein PilA
MKLRKLQKKMNQKGFTLIELIIVIAILGILAALAIPRFLGFTESAKETADEEYAAVVAQAAILYYASENVVPSVGTLVSEDYIESGYAFKSDEYAGGLSISNTGSPTCTIGTYDSLYVTLDGDSGTDYVVCK